jgi:ubiquinone/menaquinone biosynthesis C-methylase UbiE
MRNPEERSFIPALRFHWATKFYDPLVRWTTREYPFKRALLKQSDLNEKQKVLDLACGTGTLSIGIKRRFPEISVEAVDADPEILLKAKKKASERGMEINFRQSFSHELPFADEYFDRVFSTLFFHHLTLAEKRATAREIRRVLRPEGEFHLADFGQPEGFTQNALGRFISVIDGIETTRDNLDGRLGLLLEESGFREVLRTGHFKTILGTIRLFRAVK